MTLTKLKSKQKASSGRDALETLEYERCRLSPHYFLSNYVFIQDSNNQREVRWEPWDYLIQLLDDYLSPDIRELHIGKANQLGITWFWDAVLGVWLPLVHDTVNTLLVSHKEQGGSWEQIWKCTYIMDRLPPFLTRKLSTDKKSEIGFEGNDSRVLALPSTKVAGAGFNATAIFSDEQDLHPEAEENAAFLSPTIDAGKAKSVAASTRNTTVARERSYFMQRYIKIKSGAIPQAKAVFLGWRSRPTRADGMTQDEWFEQRIRPRYTAWDIDAHYPETEDQFLAEARKTSFFDPAGISWIRSDCYDPPETDYDGVVKIWSKPEVGLKYCSFLDPSDGSDPHAAGWMELVSKRLVCVSHGKVKAEKCAEIFDKYNRFYNNAFNEFELNGDAGQTVSQCLDALGTPNRRVTGKTKEGKVKHGWWTGGNINSETNRRNLMLDGLEEVVRNKRLRIHDSEVPKELEYMARKEGEPPKVPRGKNDDLIMMLGGLWQISKEARLGQSVTFSSGKCVGF